MASFRPRAKPKPIEVDKFLGLNESVGDTEVKVGEAIYMRNFRITPNYKLEKRGGHTTFIDEVQPTKPIQGMWYGRIGVDTVLVYACNGNIKKKVMPSGATTTIGTMTDAKTKMFYFTGKLFLQNGVEYKYYDGSTFADVSTIAYVPTIATGTPPTGGGTLLEEINLLTGKKKQRFVGNGSATVYQLAETNIDATLLIITVNGVTLTEITNFTVNRTTGQVTFLVAPINQADVIIQWEKASSANVQLVTKNRSSVIFGPGNATTVFMWGNTSAQNRRTYSAPLDATYFPANNFTLLGSDSTAITDMQPQQNNLIVFKEERTYYSPATLNTVTNGYDYPVFDLNYAVGNQCFDGVQVLNDTPVSLYNGATFKWALTYVESERSANDFSDRMEQSFSTLNFTQCITTDYQREQEFWINNGSLVYIYNYGNDTWYIYDNIEANCFLEINGIMYYGTKTGKIERFEGKFNDNNIAISSLWKSGFTDFGAYEYLKNSRDMWFSLQPFPATSVTIKTPTDRKNDAVTPVKTFNGGYAIFDYGNIDYGNWSYQTNGNPQSFRVKIKARKYAYIQFVFSNAELNDSLVVLSFKVLAESTSFVK